MSTALPQSEAEILWRDLERAFPTSPIHRALGLSLEVVGAGDVRIHYNGEQQGANIRGKAAGGTLAQMVDSAVVQACKTRLNGTEAVATLELKINYLRPGPPNAPLVATASIEHLGKSTCVGTGRVATEDGKVVAVGLVTVSIRPRGMDSHAQS